MGTRFRRSTEQLNANNARIASFLRTLAGNTGGQGEVPLRRASTNDSLADGIEPSERCAGSDPESAEKAAQNIAPKNRSTSRKRPEK